MADLEVRQLVREFPTPDGPLRILAGVDVELDRGQNLSVVGPSGSGKSTFLHIVGTLDQPTSGSVSILGVDPFALSPRELARFRNQHIGFVFQDHHLLPQLTALENVLIPVVAVGAATPSDQQRAAELLERVGLADRADHLPGMLSGGERQRVAVARALIRSPEILLADEPTGSLDARNAERVGQLLLDLQAAENTILICVTHDLRLAERFGRRVELFEGRFVEPGVVS